MMRVVSWRRVQKRKSRIVDIRFYIETRMTMEINNKKTKTLVAGLLATLVMTLGVTTAYLSDISEEVVNSFDPNKVTVDLSETGDGEYEIIPGTEQDKDPKVEINASVDSYIYVVITDTANTEDKTLVNYEVRDGDEGWTLLDKSKLNALDIDGDGEIDLTLDETMQVYYKAVTASEEQQGFYILKDNKVSYDSSLKNEDMPDEEVQLTFKAYAIQQKSFADAIAAWNQSSTEE